MLTTRRRVALQLWAGALLAPSCPLPAAADGVASPQPGDLLVFESGSRAGTAIAPGALPPDGPPVLAWPMDSRSRRIRHASHFAQILLVRPHLSRLQTAGSVAADGIVGFSAICTHAACVVSGWRSTEGLLFCPCHGSVYDPAAGGQVVGGPAPRPLPALPLRIADGTLTVAAGFTARIGASTGRTD